MTNFSRGDPIGVLRGRVVASRSVHKIGVDNFVFSEKLGVGRISIIIDFVIDFDMTLPIPSNKVFKLSDALDLSIIWYTNSIVPLNDVHIPTSNDDHQFGVSDSQTPFCFTIEDFVSMLVNDKIVCRRIIFKSDPLDRCHGQELGAYRVSVRIDEVVDGLADLPYGSMDAKIIGEALNSFVLWDIENV